VFYVDYLLPSYFEMLATINADKDMAGLHSNAYLIFDYQSPTDFKFAGVNPMINKLQMGHRTAEGWIVDVQNNMQLRAETDYNMLLALHGTTATLVVDGAHVLSHVFQPRIDEDGVSHGLNRGMVGLGANNSRGRIDNVAVQVLPPETTLEAAEDFADGQTSLFGGPSSGSWQVADDRYEAVPASGEEAAFSLVDLGLSRGLLPNSMLDFSVTLNAQPMSGVVFDWYGPQDFKFAAVLADSDQVVIGHHTARQGWVYDEVVDRAIESGRDYDLALSLRGTSVAVSLDGAPVVGHVFNAPLVDGRFGLLTGAGGGLFDAVSLRTDDPAFAAGEETGGSQRSSGGEEAAPASTVNSGDNLSTSTSVAPVNGRFYDPSHTRLPGDRLQDETDRTTSRLGSGTLVDQLRFDLPTFEDDEDREDESDLRDGLAGDWLIVNR
jgi:hypothetical protein